MRAVGRNVANSVHAAERFLNVTGHVVGNILLIHTAVSRDERDSQNVGIAGFTYRHPLILHILRQFFHCRLQLVLYLLHGFVGIGSGGKGQRNRRLTRRAALGRHIHQVIEAGHILLDNLGDGIFQRLCGGTWIIGGNAHVRRRKIGILLDGK